MFGFIFALVVILALGLIFRKEIVDEVKRVFNRG